MIQSDGGPWRLKAYLRGDQAKIRTKIEVNRAIILEVLRDMRAKELDHVFVIFHPRWVIDEVDDWRYQNEIIAAEIKIRVRGD